MKALSNFIACLLLMSHSAWAMGRKKPPIPPESPRAFVDSAYWQGQVRFAKSNLKALYNGIALDSGTLGTLRFKKCGSNYDCYLNECDIQIPNCRSDHVLFFRGEGDYPTIGVSSAVRYQLEHPEYCGADCSGMKLLDLLDAYLAKQYPGLQSPADLVSKAVTLHQDGDHFNGSKINCTLDPLISVSPIPDYAMEFETGSSDRMLVLSMPEKQVPQSCSDGFPKPGEIIMSRKCKDFDSQEPEADFVLYINPEYILGVTR